MHNYTEKCRVRSYPFLSCSVGGQSPNLPPGRIHPVLMPLAGLALPRGPDLVAELLDQQLDDVSEVLLSKTGISVGRKTWSLCYHNN